MNILEILLQVGTVFLGAFLAFGLENFRERRQLKGWTNTYLKRIRSGLDAAPTHQFVDGLKEIVAGYDALIYKKKASYTLWQPLMTYAVSATESYSSLIGSPAITTLPVEVVGQLDKIEFHRQNDGQFSAICFGTYQQYTVPILLEERSLSEKEVSGLQYTRATFDNRVKSMEEGLELERELLELLDKHNLGR